MGHTMKILNLIFLIIFCIVLLVFAAHAVASSNEIFWTSFGAALGGFLGATIWFSILIARLLRSKKNFIKSYSCANKINLGDNDEMDGELKHYHGKRVDNNSELGVKNPVWEWTRDSVGRGKVNDAVIYGPYSTDFAESGKYSVVFMVKGKGFTQAEDISRDVPVLLLDVTRTIEHYIPNVDGGIQNIKVHNRFAVKYVRASELATLEWKSFELVFNCDGPGLWEYRVYAYDGVSLRPNNIGKFDENIRIFFDKVTISKINKVQISW